MIAVPPGGSLIGPLSRSLGSTPRALRHYEAMGLVVPQRIGVYRIYSREDHNKLRMIVEARRAGLGIEQIRDILDLDDPSDRGASQIAKAVGYMRERVRELEAQRDLAIRALAELERRQEQPRTPQMGPSVRQGGDGNVGIPLATVKVTPIVDQAGR